MRESRFIELLNLYVDHQLSPDDAAELQAEISRNAKRRHTYDQYCRIQKACTQLFEQERTLAPSSRLLTTALLEAEAKVDAPPARLPIARVFYPVGIAAAACFALILFRHGEAPAQNPMLHADQSVAVASPAHNATIAPVAPAPANIAAVAAAKPSNNRPNFYSVFATRPAVSLADENENLVAPPNDGVVSVSWMHAMELAPLADLNQSLTLRATPATYDTRTLRPRRSDDSHAESAAFQFQR